MLPSSLLSTTALLYYVCFGLLFGMTGFVLFRNSRSWLNRGFALTALSLLAWLGTLFVYERTLDPKLTLWLGRINFAAIAFTVFFAYLLVHTIASKPVPRRQWIGQLGETLLLGFLSAATPLVDKAEVVHTAAVAAAPAYSSHTTVFGPLAVLYFAHTLAYLGAAVLAAFRLRSVKGLSPNVRDQLLLIGGGMLATSAVALVTNVLLPYTFADFRLIDIGPLSTILFLAAVAYAIARHHLFDIRLFIRKTLVWGLLLTLIMSVYSAVVLLVTDHLTQGAANSLTRFGVLILAFSFDPLRRFLEQKIDHLLFPSGERPTRPKKKHHEDRIHQ